MAVGMPEITPVVGLSANPDGSAPLVTVQLRGGCATGCHELAPRRVYPPCRPTGRCVLMVSGPEGFTVMVKVGLI